MKSASVDVHSLEVSVLVLALFAINILCVNNGTHNSTFVTGLQHVSLPFSHPWNANVYGNDTGKQEFTCVSTDHCVSVRVLEPPCSRGYLAPPIPRTGYLKVTIRGDNLCGGNSSLSAAWLWASGRDSGRREITRCSQLWTCLVPLRALLQSSRENIRLEVVLYAAESSTPRQLPVALSLRTQHLNRRRQLQRTAPLSVIERTAAVSHSKDFQQDTNRSSSPPEKFGAIKTTWYRQEAIENRKDVRGFLKLLSNKKKNTTIVNDVFLSRGYKLYEIIKNTKQNYPYDIVRNPLVKSNKSFIRFLQANRHKPYRSTFQRFVKNSSPEETNTTQTLKLSPKQVDADKTLAFVRKQENASEIVPTPIEKLFSKHLFLLSQTNNFTETILSTASESNNSTEGTLSTLNVEAVKQRASIDAHKISRERRKASRTWYKKTLFKSRKTKVGKSFQQAPHQPNISENVYVAVVPNTASNQNSSHRDYVSTRHATPSQEHTRINKVPTLRDYRTFFLGLPKFSVMSWTQGSSKRWMRATLPATLWKHGNRQREKRSILSVTPWKHSNRQRGKRNILPVTPQRHGNRQRGERSILSRTLWKRGTWPRRKRSIRHVDDDEASDLAILMEGETSEDRSRIAAMIASDFESTEGLSDPVVVRPHKAESTIAGGKASFTVREGKQAIKELDHLINVLEDEQAKVASNAPPGDDDDEDLLVTPGSDAHLAKLRHQLMVKKRHLAHAKTALHRVNLRVMAASMQELGRAPGELIVMKGNLQARVRELEGSVGWLRGKYNGLVKERKSAQKETRKFHGVVTLDPAWTLWSAWSNCPGGCSSGGFSTRRRSCDTLPSVPCPGTDFDMKPCNNVTCEGQWLDWEAWGPCSATCGRGVRTRSRVCQSGSSSSSVTCQGSPTAMVICDQLPCSSYDDAGEVLLPPPAPPTPPSVKKVRMKYRKLVPVKSKTGKASPAKKKPQKAKRKIKVKAKKAKPRKKATPRRGKRRAAVPVRGKSRPPPVQVPKKFRARAAVAAAAAAGAASAAEVDDDDLISDDEEDAAVAAAEAVAHMDPANDAALAAAAAAAPAAAAVGAAAGAAERAADAVDEDEDEEDEEEEEFPLTGETIAFIVLLIICLLLIMIAFCIWFSSRYQDAQMRKELSEALPFYSLHSSKGGDDDDDGGDGLEGRARGVVKPVLRQREALPVDTGNKNIDDVSSPKKKGIDTDSPKKPKGSSRSKSKSDATEKGGFWGKFKGWSKGKKGEGQDVQFAIHQSEFPAGALPVGYGEAKDKARLLESRSDVSGAGDVTLSASEINVGVGEHGAGRYGDEVKTPKVHWTRARLSRHRGKRLWENGVRDSNLKGRHRRRFGEMAPVDGRANESASDTDQSRMTRKSSSFPNLLKTREGSGLWLYSDAESSGRDRLSLAPTVRPSFSETLVTREVRGHGHMEAKDRSRFPERSRRAQRKRGQGEKGKRMFSSDHGKGQGKRSQRFRKPGWTVRASEGHHQILTRGEEEKATQNPDPLPALTDAGSTSAYIDTTAVTAADRQTRILAGDNGHTAADREGGDDVFREIKGLQLDGTTREKEDLKLVSKVKSRNVSGREPGVGRRDQSSTDSTSRPQSLYSPVASPSSSSWLASLLSETDLKLGDIDREMDSVLSQVCPPESHQDWTDSSESFAGSGEVFRNRDTSTTETVSSTTGVSKFRRGRNFREKRQSETSGTATVSETLSRADTRANTRIRNYTQPRQMIVDRAGLRETSYSDPLHKQGEETCIPGPTRKEASYSSEFTEGAQDDLSAEHSSQNKIRSRDSLCYSKISSPGHEETEQGLQTQTEPDETRSKESSGSNDSNDTSQGMVKSKLYGAQTGNRHFETPSVQKQNRKSKEVQSSKDAKSSDSSIATDGSVESRTKISNAEDTYSASMLNHTSTGITDTENTFPSEGQQSQDLSDNGIKGKYSSIKYKHGKKELDESTSVENSDSSNKIHLKSSGSSDHALPHDRKHKKADAIDNSGESKPSIGKRIQDLASYNDHYVRGKHFQEQSLEKKKSDHHSFQNAQVKDCKISEHDDTPLEAELRKVQQDAAILLDALGTEDKQLQSVTVSTANPTATPDSEGQDKGNPTNGAGPNEGTANNLLKLSDSSESGSKMAHQEGESGSENLQNPADETQQSAGAGIYHDPWDSPPPEPPKTPTYEEKKQQIMWMFNQDVVCVPPFLLQPQKNSSLRYTPCSIPTQSAKPISDVTSTQEMLPCATHGMCSTTDQTWTPSSSHNVGTSSRQNLSTVADQDMITHSHKNNWESGSQSSWVLSNQSAGASITPGSIASTGQGRKISEVQLSQPVSNYKSSATDQTKKACQQRRLGACTPRKPITFGANQDHIISSHETSSSTPFPSGSDKKRVPTRKQFAYRPSAILFSDGSSKLDGSACSSSEDSSTRNNPVSQQGLSPNKNKTAEATEKSHLPQEPHAPSQAKTYHGAKSLSEHKRLTPCLHGTDISEARNFDNISKSLQQYREKLYSNSLETANDARTNKPSAMRAESDWRGVESSLAGNPKRFQQEVESFPDAAGPERAGKESAILESSLFEQLWQSERLKELSKERTWDRETNQKDRSLMNDNALRNTQVPGLTSTAGCGASNEDTVFASGVRETRVSDTHIITDISRDTSAPLILSTRSSNDAVSPTSIQPQQRAETKFSNTSHTLQAHSLTNQKHNNHGSHFSCDSQVGRLKQPNQKPQVSTDTSSKQFLETLNKELDTFVGTASWGSSKNPGRIHIDWDRCSDVRKKRQQEKLRRVLIPEVCHPLQTQGQTSKLTTGQTEDTERASNCVCAAGRDNDGTFDKSQSFAENMSYQTKRGQLRGGFPTVATSREHNCRDMSPVRPPQYDPYSHSIMELGPVGHSSYRGERHGHQIKNVADHNLPLILPQTEKSFDCPNVCSGFHLGVQASPGRDITKPHLTGHNSSISSRDSDSLYSTGKDDVSSLESWASAETGVLPRRTQYPGIAVVAESSPRPTQSCVAAPADSKGETQACRFSQARPRRLPQSVLVLTPAEVKLITAAEELRSVGRPAVEEESGNDSIPGHRTAPTSAIRAKMSLPSYRTSGKPVTYFHAAVQPYTAAYDTVMTGLHSSQVRTGCRPDAPFWTPGVHVIPPDPKVPLSVSNGDNSPCASDFQSLPSAGGASPQESWTSANSNHLALEPNDAAISETKGSFEIDGEEFNDRSDYLSTQIISDECLENNPSVPLNCRSDQETERDSDSFPISASFHADLDLAADNGSGGHQQSYKTEMSNESARSGSCRSKDNRSGMDAEYRPDSGTEYGSDLGTNYRSDFGTEHGSELGTNYKSDFGTEYDSDVGTDLPTKRVSDQSRKKRLVLQERCQLDSVTENVITSNLTTWDRDNVSETFAKKDLDPQSLHFGPEISPQPETGRGCDDVTDCTVRSPEGTKSETDTDDPLRVLSQLGSVHSSWSAITEGELGSKHSPTREEMSLNDGAYNDPDSVGQATSSLRLSHAGEPLSLETRSAGITGEDSPISKVLNECCDGASATSKRLPDISPQDAVCSGGEASQTTASEGLVFSGTSAFCGTSSNVPSTVLTSEWNTDPVVHGETKSGETNNKSPDPCRPPYLATVDYDAVQREEAQRERAHLNMEESEALSYQTSGISLPTNIDLTNTVSVFPKPTSLLSPDKDWSSTLTTSAVVGPAANTANVNAASLKSQDHFSADTANISDVTTQHVLCSDEFFHRPNSIAEPTFEHSVQMPNHLTQKTVQASENTTSDRTLDHSSYIHAQQVQHSSETSGQKPEHSNDSNKQQKHSSQSCSQDTNSSVQVLEHSTQNHVKTSEYSILKSLEHHDQTTETTNQYTALLDHQSSLPLHECSVQCCSQGGETCTNKHSQITDNLIQTSEQITKLSSHCYTQALEMSHGQPAISESVKDLTEGSARPVCISSGSAQESNDGKAASSRPTNAVYYQEAGNKVNAKGKEVESDLINLESSIELESHPAPHASQAHGGIPTLSHSLGGLGWGRGGDEHRHDSSGPNVKESKGLDMTTMNNKEHFSHALRNAESLPQGVHGQSLQFSQIFNLPECDCSQATQESKSELSAGTKFGKFPKRPGKNVSFDQTLELPEQETGPDCAGREGGGEQREATTTERKGKLVSLSMDESFMKAGTSERTDCEEWLISRSFESPVSSVDARFLVDSPVRCFDGRVLCSESRGETLEMDSSRDFSLGSMITLFNADTNDCQQTIYGLSQATGQDESPQVVYGSPQVADVSMSTLIHRHERSAFQAVNSGKLSNSASALCPIESGQQRGESNYRESTGLRLNANPTFSIEISESGNHNARMDKRHNIAGQPFTAAGMPDLDDISVSESGHSSYDGSDKASKVQKEADDCTSSSYYWYEENCSCRHGQTDRTDTSSPAGETSSDQPSDLLSSSKSHSSQPNMMLRKAVDAHHSGEEICSSSEPSDAELPSASDHMEHTPGILDASCSSCEFCHPGCGVTCDIEPSKGHDLPAHRDTDRTGSPTSPTGSCPGSCQATSCSETSSGKRFYFSGERSDSDKSSQHQATNTPYKQRQEYLAATSLSSSSSSKQSFSQNTNTRIALRKLEKPDIDCGLEIEDVARGQYSSSEDIIGSFQSPRESAWLCGGETFRHDPIVSPVTESWSYIASPSLSEEGSPCFGSSSYPGEGEARLGVPILARRRQHSLTVTEDRSLSECVFSRQPKSAVITPQIQYHDLDLTPSKFQDPTDHVGTEDASAKSQLKESSTATVYHSLAQEATVDPGTELISREYLVSHETTDLLDSPLFTEDCPRPSVQTQVECPQLTMASFPAAGISHSGSILLSQGRLEGEETIPSSSSRTYRSMTEERPAVFYTRRPHQAALPKGRSYRTSALEVKTKSERATAEPSLEPVEADKGRGSRSGNRQADRGGPSYRTHLRSKSCSKRDG